MYRAEEIAALGDVAKRRGLAMHMDGARFANAAATIGGPPRAFTWEAGVDVLCFGGTKNGLAVGEAVVFFRKELAREFDFRCKQAGQLSSKMRFLAAPWVGMLRDGAWLRHGAHANAMALRLARGLAAIAGVKLIAPVEANGVFVEMPPSLASAMQRDRGWEFYNFIGDRGYRLMCSWETTEAAVDAFLADVSACAAGL